MTSKKSQHNIQIKSYRNRRVEEFPILLRAMEFFLDELLKRCTLEYKLNLKVSLRNGPVLDDDGIENEGLAWEHKIKDETWYTIHLNNDSPFLELLSTLAHESVHVVQFATGRLKFNGEWIWDGVSYGEEPYRDTDLDTKLPWEYDAYSKEIELSRKFIKKFYSNW